MGTEGVRACLLIPHFDHVDQFQHLLPALTRIGLPILVVDDASPAAEFSRLEALLQRLAPGSILLRHEQNQGKGGSVMTGLRAAADAAFTHALQIDADGQHDVQSLPKLLDAARAHPGRLICGLPSFGPDISRLRYYSRFLTLYLCWLETLSKEIQDALCGFRAYPLASVMPIIQRNPPGRRMAFDPEILVRACWAGIPLHYLPVKVNYPENGRSHFRYIHDNLEITQMHVRLIGGMLLRLRLLLPRMWRRRCVERA